MSTLSSVRFFEYYLMLPPELRMMVIDEMAPDDRGRFSRCSKLCNIETKSSKNYLFGLEIIGYSENYIEINVIHGGIEEFGKYHGYMLEFKNELGRKFVRYLTFGYKELWSIEISHSANLVLPAIIQFKKYLNLYQNNIKRLTIIGQLFNNSQIVINLGIERLKSLEYLKVNSNVVPHVFSKLLRPLKSFESFGEDYHGILTSYEEIYYVQDYVNLPRIKLTQAQFLTLTASKIHIHIGELTEENVLFFIKSWQNGNIRRSFKYCQWDLRGSNFNVRKLFRLLGKVIGDSSNVKMRLKHYKYCSGNADLFCSKDRLQLGFMTMN